MRHAHLDHTSAERRKQTLPARTGKSRNLWQNPQFLRERIQRSGTKWQNVLQMFLDITFFVKRRSQAQAEVHFGRSNTQNMGGGHAGQYIAQYSAVQHSTKYSIVQHGAGPYEQTSGGEATHQGCCPLGSPLLITQEGTRGQASVLVIVERKFHTFSLIRNSLFSCRICIFPKLSQLSFWIVPIFSAKNHPQSVYVIHIQVATNVALLHHI